MQIDGAHEGITPTKALEIILGGRPMPTELERLSREALMELISLTPDTLEELNESSPDKQTPHAYNKGCYWLAKQFYELRKNGVSGDIHALYFAMTQYNGSDKKYEFTGFMVGWANNASLWLLDLPPQPNPAIRDLPEPVKKEKPNAIKNKTKKH